MLPRKRDTSQSHIKGPFSGPALTIMPFNVEGLSAAKEQLIADLRQRLQCAVVCIQETHRGPDAIRPSIPGMDLAIERPHSQYGSAIFVTSGTIVNTTSLTDINNIDILRVDLNGISVTSVNKPPGERVSFHQPLTAVGDQQQVIIGDFNSHSSTWGYATTNTDGELVEDWAEYQRLSLIHDPKLPSSFNSGRWRRGYNPDIIFATIRIAGCCNKIVMEPIPRSQHRPIGVQVNAAIIVQTVPFRRRFNLKKANWEQYAYQLDAAVENIPATAECYDQFVNALRKVARKNIPRGCRRDYVPRLTPGSIQLIEEYREKYEDFADSTITLGDELMSAISEERRKAWQNLIESADMTHNSKKAWSTIRKLCDDPCNRSSTATPQRTKWHTNSYLNGRAPIRQVRLNRQRYPDDPGFTRAFTAEELDIGIRVRKNGKAPGLDDIQSFQMELIKQFGPKAHDWLLRFFNNYTETKKIPKLWRQAKVVALLKPGKDPSVAKSYRPISLLCHTYKLCGAEWEEEPFATTTKRTATRKCTGTDVVQHLHQRPDHTHRHSQLHLRRRLVHRVARKRLQHHRSVSHVCPEHYDYQLRQ